ncbi:MAG: hypothetical protein WD431_09510 [Cyclobacteriaceae bacterium]
MQNKIKTRYAWLLIIGLTLAFSCVPDENEQYNNLIVSEEFEDEIFFVEHMENGYNIQIKTNNPAVFMPSEARATIEIDPSGTATLDNGPGVYYVDYYFENSPNNVLTLPLLITPNISMARNTLNLLKNLETENEGYALVLRHTQARLGDDIVDSPIPEWWKSCDPTVARQLNDEGKRNAGIIGNAIKKLKIPIGAAVSSEFCRAVQTIEFMELDINFQTDSRLNHENENEKSPMFEDVYDLIRESTQTGGIQMLVGHYNILEGHPHRSTLLPFNMADGFLMRKKADGELEFTGTVPFYFWLLFE